MGEEVSSPRTFVAFQVQSELRVSAFNSCFIRGRILKHPGLAAEPATAAGVAETTETIRAGGLSPALLAEVTGGTAAVG